jgi:CheY-like chemotaxis protein
MAAGRVLLVDDYKPIVEILLDFLSGEGYVVEVARDGEEALAHIRADPPDLLLLDLKLPRMSGEEVIAELARSQLQIPIVIVTASIPLPTWHPPPDVAEVLEKPFDLEDLLVLVERFCPQPQDG